MRSSLALLLFALLLIVPIRAASADTDSAPYIAGIPSALLSEALQARDLHAGRIKDPRYLTIIDYRLPSRAKRLYFVDLDSGRADAFLVAHGRGSDPDHDGMADTFSNVSGSKMSSLGSFVTGRTYHGRHGLSLRLHGLDPHNDKAFERAIVIHGADYVSPNRRKVGRSWGCPALEREVAGWMIPKIAGGSFVYAVGPDAASS